MIRITLTTLAVLATIAMTLAQETPVPSALVEETLVPSDYTNRTVEWAMINLDAVGLGIQVKAPGGEFHTPGADELSRTISSNASGSMHGQARPSSGNAHVVLRPI